MDLRQLRHFVVLAEEMHFGRAAERLRITQPALSTSILRLEQDLGVRLFDRDSKGVSITAAGRLMLPYAHDMLAQEGHTQQFAKALAAGKLGRIEVGFSGAIPDPRFHRLILEFRDRHPSIEIFMRETTSPRQIEMILAGRMDAGLVSSPFAPAGLEHLMLYENRYVACVPRGHRLAQRDVVDITELRDDPFVMLSRDNAPRVHELLMGYFSASGVSPKVVCEAAHTLSTVALVGRGLGVALVIEALVDIGIAGVVFLPLRRPLLSRRSFFVWNAGRMAPGLEALIAAVRHVAVDAPAQA